MNCKQYYDRRRRRLKQAGLESVRDMNKNKPMLEKKHLHARQRLMERYRVEYTYEFYRSIRKKIRKGDVLASARVTESRDRVDIMVKNKIFRMVWNRERQEVVTFLA